MRTLSRRCKYGLRALYRLTYDYARGPIPLAAIAHREHIPRKFLEVILVQLRDRGLVESWKGKKGGYCLSRPPSAITLGEIIRAVDGPLAPSSCASETAYAPCPECLNTQTCETRLVLRKVRDAMASVLDNTTLADICMDDKPEDVVLYFEI